MFQRSILAVLLVSYAAIADADVQPMPYPARGELLYSTHCIDCHNTQVHWRDKKLSTDWNSLQTEVDRWQKIARLEWGEDDVMAVARYLNSLHYRYPAPD